MAKTSPDRLTQKPGDVVLTAEQIANVRLGLDDIEKGRTHTTAEVRESLQRKHEAWLKTRSD